jgi:DNA-binding NarL/FixJ family response regulator
MKPGTACRRVFLVDDHPILLQGLSMLIDEQDDLCVCGRSSTAEEAIRTIASARADVAIVDLSLQGSSGLGLIRDLHARHPQLPILVLSMHEEALFAERALRAGALGYVMKQEPGSELLAALRRVLRGEVHLSQRQSQGVFRSLIQGRAVRARSPIGLLSDRELEVFELIGRGLKTGEIARRLHIDVKTVQTHRARLKQKLGLPDSGKLALFAVKWTSQD